MGAVNRSKPDQFQLRLPRGLRDQLKRAAETAGRSLNSEIIARLEAPEHDGATLRDQIAMAALPSIILATSAGQHHPEGDGDLIDLMARDAYAMADAMMDARKGSS